MLLNDPSLHIISITVERVCDIGGLIMVGENEKYSGKNLLHGHVIHHKPHMGWLGIEPGPPCFSFVPVTLCFRCHAPCVVHELAFCVVA
jgi:hypothetical protein